MTHCLPEHESRLGAWVLWHTKMRSRDWECGNCRKRMVGRKNLMLLQLELGVFEHPHLHLWDIDTYLHQVLGTIGQPKHILLLVGTHTTLDVNVAKLDFILHIVNGAEFLTHTLAYRSWGTMFSIYDLGIAQRPCIGLHCSTSFDWVGGQSCNMPLRGMAVSL